MVPPSYTGGLSNKRVAHFLKPTVASLQDSSLKLPILTLKKWLLDLSFNGWQVKVKMWVKWVDKMFPKFHSLWKKVGILEAILCSKYNFDEDYDLIFGLTERWCADTNTFVFPWGEASITLEAIMILGGFSILGEPVLLPLVEKELIDIETNLKEELRKFEKIRSCTHVEWIDFFMRHNSQFEHEAFLTFWLSRYVFPVHGFNEIIEYILPIAIRLARGKKLALAPSILATLYRDLSMLKENMASSTRLEAEKGERIMLPFSLWSPFHLVQLWAWERIEPLHPKPNSLKLGEPRVARWHNLPRLQIGNVRHIIDSCSKGFQWRPYCLAIDNWILPCFYMEKEERLTIGQNIDKELECFARCLRVCLLVGIKCEEVYQPQRIAMQFGYDQDLPGLISRPNSGIELAFIEYSRPLNNNESLYFPPRLAKPDVSIQYLNWWRKTVLVPVNSIQCKRGRRTARKARNYSQFPQQIRVVDTDCRAESVEVPIEDVNVSNYMKQSRVKEEDEYPSGPPGFSSKFNETMEPNDLQNSPMVSQSIGLGSSIMHMFDLNLPPKSPTGSQNAGAETPTMHMIYLNPLDSPLGPQNTRAKSSTMHVIDVIFSPLSLPGLQSARTETSTKCMIDLNLPPKPTS